jgi:hypothetical protein
MPRMTDTAVTKGADTAPITPPPIPPEPPVKLSWGGLAVATGLAVVVGAILIALVRELQAPTLSRPISPASAAAELGYFLGRWGLALILIGFVPLLVIQVMRAFAWKDAKAAVAAEVPGSDLWKQLIEGIPNLIKTPVGVGMSLILVGALLLLGTSWGADPGVSPTPTPSASP